MAKGMWTQGVMVLLESAVTLDALEAVLSGYDVAKRIDVPPQGGDWMRTWPGLVIPYRPEVNGYVVVDLVDRQWPDHMGDPKKEMHLFAAWSMGQMGPATFPGGLERALQQSWNWNAAPEIVARHRAMIRVRSSYVLGGADNDPVLPADYEPVAELDFVTRLALAAAQVSQALCVFNPGGETLFTAEALQATLDHDSRHKLPALDAWTNVRIFNLSDLAPWMIVDSIGMHQLDLRDQEFCFDSDRHDVNEVAQTVRNMSVYRLQNGEVIQNGDTIDIGDQRWQCLHSNEALLPGPRDVLRWFPLDGTRAPNSMLKGVKLKD